MPTDKFPISARNKKNITSLLCAYFCRNLKTFQTYLSKAFLLQVHN